MAIGVRLSAAMLGAILSAHAALAQEPQTELTPAGRAIVAPIVAGEITPIIPSGASTKF